MRSLPSHNNKENLIASTGNVLLINLRIWKKIPVLYSATHGLKRIILTTHFQETVNSTPWTPLTTNRSRDHRRLIKYSLFAMHYGKGFQPPLGSWNTFPENRFFGPPLEGSRGCPFSGNLKIPEITCSIWHFYPVWICPSSFRRK